MCQSYANFGKIAFYQTFGRPIAKVFLMSTFIYQLTYWAWAKLEKDEIHAEKQGSLFSGPVWVYMQIDSDATAEIAALETKLQGITTREKP